MTIYVTREEIVKGLKIAANSCWMGLREFYEEGRTDRLDDPYLRSLWLI